MKAIHVTAIGSPEVLRPVEIPDPSTPPGALRIRNRAIGVNFQDIQSRRHAEPGTELPFVPGTDFAGEVDELGEGVEGFSVGDRVLGIHVRGAYAEKAVVPNPLAVPLPDDISFEQAAAYPVAGPNFAQSFEMAAVGGTVVLLGRAAGDAPPETVETALLRGRRNLGLRSYFLGTSIQSQTERLPSIYEILFEGLTSGAIFLPIETLPLEEAVEAHARIESQATAGKVILLP